MDRIRREKIIDYSGFDVGDYIQPLKLGKYEIINESMAGDAPKEFVRLYEYQPGTIRRNRPNKWPAYIAKVGHKWYPNESITEHLLTRVGQILNVSMAHSRLMKVHGQVRFMSRYFLNSNERLVHGAEIFAGYLEDESFVDEVERTDAGRELFTFQFIEEAIGNRFTNDRKAILAGFVRMLGFDAIVGNNDRHHYNWGVIEDIHGERPFRFAPVYDSARALFWNLSEKRLVNKFFRGDSEAKKKNLTKYVDRSRPKTGCDGFTGVDHFQLIESLCRHKVAYRNALTEFNEINLMEEVSSLFKGEFRDLFSPPRKQIISDCLELRMNRFREVVTRTV